MLIQVLFAIMMLLGIGALYVDLGMARLAQIQMQNAADTAALEGLRHRDALKEVCNGLMLDATQCSTLGLNPAQCTALGLTPGQCDTYKNMNPRHMASFAAADYGSGAQSIGTGPLVSFQDDPRLTGLDTSEIAPSRYIDSAATLANRAYRPQLQANLANACEGDMVAGFFDAAQSHGEDSTYVRQDYTRQAGTPDDCTASTIPAVPTSMLVRLRRTGENFVGSDSSSNGPAIPLLLGQASQIQKVGGSSPKVDGIPVHATAIAQTRPAFRVGSAPGSPLRSAPFALTATLWGNLPEGSATLIVSGGNLTLPLAVGSGVLSHRAQRVGETIAAPQDAPEVGPGFVAIYEPSLANRVIGFGYVLVEGFVPNASLTLTKTSFRVATSNATAAGGVLATSPADFAALSAANRHLYVLDDGTPGPGGLLVPALAR